MHPLFMKQKRLLFDGAFGTYYASLYGNEEPCEMANVKAPTRVAAIHEEYLKAGANAIKTNTFAMNEAVLDCSKAKREELLRQGYRIAKRVATPYQASVFADIGPCVETRTRSAFTQYKELVDVFLEEGADCFLFETLPNDHGIHEIAAYLKERCPHVCVLVSFAVTADGYTQQGVPLTKLVKAAHEDENIHGFGLNCICGPMHMRRLLKYFDTKKDTILIMPNAGYPTILANHTYFRDNSSYYAQEMEKISSMGVRILGGCCGSKPSYIQKIKERLQEEAVLSLPTPAANDPVLYKDCNPLRKKLQRKEKVICVEFDPPMDCRIERFMNDAEYLKEQGIDAITIADCPIARARVDSSLLACKLHRELGIDVIPHMTCRDRNINATKALLFGLNIEDIYNVLVVTGDPIPAADRQEVKGVFSFNSQLLAGYIRDLNETTFPHPFLIFGALNVNAANFKQELLKAKQKIQQGVQAFLTQPIHSAKGLQNLQQAHRELDAWILGGVMPIVSYRNALYMKNEIASIEVDDAILSRYEHKNREEAAVLAVTIAKATIDEMVSFVDGFYLITPFHRVEIMQQIIAHIQQMDD